MTISCNFGSMILTERISYITIGLELIILVMLCWSIAFPSKRIWPPASWRSVGFWVIWGSVIFIFTGLISLSLITFNTWIIPSSIRWFLGLPITGIGVLFTAWALATLGTQNSLGIQAGFIVKGPYKFCRNPQYLGDIFILLGGGLFINSELLTTPALLACLCFWLAPFSEEIWLKERYGAAYETYCKTISRFF